MAYQFIKDRFRELLSKSPTIEGRFYMLPKYLQELNSGDLEQCIAEANIPNLKSGPLVAMLPPVAFGSYRDNSSSWSRYVLVIYFLRTSFTDESGVVRQVSPVNTSRVRLDQDWDEMKKVAQDTFKTLDKWFSQGSFNNKLLINKIRFASKNQDVITPVSLQGNERRSGVKAVTQIEVNEECDVSEYDLEAINTLINSNIL